MLKYYSKNVKVLIHKVKVEYDCTKIKIVVQLIKEIM